MPPCRPRRRPRVAIARALVAGPRVVFADEPTGALDTRSAREVLALLQETVRIDGRTLVMVTHDPVAAAHADQVLFLADGRLVGRLDRPDRRHGRRYDDPAHRPGRRAPRQRRGVRALFWLAWASLRRRAGSFAGSFLVLLFGATMVMSFASMLDTSRGSGVDATSVETLTTMGGVVGGWGMCLVVFAVISTLGLSVRQRAAETALLKSAGATPAQITRMIVGEAALVSVAAAVLAVGPSYLLGRALLALLVDTGQVDDGTAFVFGTIALLIGFGITVLSAVIGALWTARHATGASVAASLADADPGRMTWKRVVPAGVLLTGGLYLGVLTVTAFRDKGPDAMPVAAQASILTSMGLASSLPAWCAPPSP